MNEAEKKLLGWERSTDKLSCVACAQCGYPAAKLRSFNWGLKAKRRKTTYVYLHLARSHSSFNIVFLAVPAEWLTSRTSTDDSRTVSERVVPPPRRPRPSKLSTRNWAFFGGAGGWWWHVFITRLLSFRLRAGILFGMIGEVDEVAAKNSAIDGRILNEMGQKASYGAMCMGRLLRKIRCLKMAMTNVEPEDSSSEFTSF